MKTDISPQFISELFERYLNETGIKHGRTTPRWPQANGEVKRQNNALLKCMRIAQAQGQDWKKELNKFLLAYRTTPHSTTGALCSKAHLNSSLSEILRVTWPGVLPPTLRRVPTNKRNSLKVAWNDLYSTGGVKIASFKGVCVEVTSENHKRRGSKNEVVRKEAGPLHPDARTTELLQHLSLYQYTSVDSPGVKPPDAQAARLSSTLVDVENSLKHCLLKLEKLSGTMYVDVEWTPAEDDGDALVNGYQVLVNGKQYGSLLNTYVNHTRLKLNAYDLVHRISIVTVTNHPVGNSEPSDEIAVFTEPFLPFATFCFHNIHSKDVRFPEEGCCAYSDSLSKELNSDSLGTYNIAAVNLGTLRRRVPPAAVTVLDVFEGAWHLLIPTKLRKPTIILFWTKWCLASKIAMKSFVRYSRGHGKRISFITCCCASYESTTNHRHSLAEVIVENAWRDDKCIRHCCSCHSTSPGFNPAKKSTANNKHKSGKEVLYN
uniref:Uncharacterized protein LOC102805368 n=1 Tax=Saccoglossus kowalevskii TaxID=10224 RepID=A0ABM0M020_SACKO|nr:PREDICTED: uncharacterized protein LOC102805368 [Saccoglossus kowalevskii]